jgi:HK97 family phage portal protein
MAESSGSSMTWARKAAFWLAQKSAAAAGVSLTLKDGALGSFFGGSTYTGKSVTEQSAMQVSTVWACVRILAEAVGQLPWAIYEREKTGNLTKIDHELGEVLIDAPNADMTSNEYREAFMTNIGLRGNGYSLLDRSPRGRINSAYPLRSRDVQVKRRVDGRLVDATQYSEGELVYQVNDRGRWETYEQSQIWHKRIFSLDGVNGLSPISYAREAMGFSAGLEEFGARLFGQGANVGSVIKIPTWLKPEQRVEAMKKLEQLYQGLVNSGKPFLLEGGMDIDKGVLPPEDAQFLELRGFQADDICRFYLVPPHRVARLERATNNNIEQLSLEFVMYTLLPYLVKIERSADRWLFKAGERGRYVVRFNYDGLLRADSEGRSKLESVWLQNGVVSRNQVRALENMPRSDAPGMDDYTVQSNMISVDELQAIADAMRKNGGKTSGATQ